MEMNKVFKDGLWSKEINVSDFVYTKKGTCYVNFDSSFLNSLADVSADVTIYSIEDRFFAPLPLHFPQAPGADVADVAVDIDDDGDGHGGLRGADSDGEQGEEEPFELLGEEEAVEDHEIDVHRVENQLDRNQHRQQVAARDESVNAHEHHHRGDNQVIFHVYHSRVF